MSPNSHALDSERGPPGRWRPGTSWTFPALYLSLAGRCGGGRRQGEQLWHWPWALGTVTCCIGLSTLGWTPAWSLHLQENTGQLGAPGPRIRLELSPGVLLHQALQTGDTRVAQPCLHSTEHLWQPELQLRRPFPCQMAGNPLSHSRHCPAAGALGPHPSRRRHLVKDSCSLVLVLIRS